MAVLHDYTAIVQDFHAVVQKVVAVKQAEQVQILHEGKSNEVLHEGKSIRDTAEKYLAGVAALCRTQ